MASSHLKLDDTVAGSSRRSIYRVSRMRRRMVDPIAQAGAEAPVGVATGTARAMRIQMHNSTCMFYTRWSQGR